MTTTPTVGIVGGTGPAGAGLAVRFAASGIPVLLGSRDADRADAKATELQQHWPQITRITGVANRDACAADIVVLATTADAIVDTAASLADALAGKVTVCMANVMTRTKRGFEAVLPAQGSVAGAVQQVAPAAVIVGAFQNLPAAALGDLGCSLNADVLVTGDDAAAVQAVIELTARVDGLQPIDAGGLANTAGVEALTPILINVNRKRKGEHSVRLVDLHGTH